MKKLTKDQFIERSNKKHNFKYDYSKSVYDGLSSDVNIRCPIHGVFIQSARNHAYAGSGCNSCSAIDKRKRRIDKFKKLMIIDFKNVHGDRYDYSLFDYEKSSKKSAIVCKEHGIFYQNANNHKKGKGCSKCTLGTSSFKREEYIKLCNDKFDSKTNIYLIKVKESDKKFFYKVGITVNDMKIRFSGSSMPYEYEVVRLIKSRADLIFDAEIQIKKLIFKNRYEPNIKFAGSKYECFDRISDEIIEIFDRLEGVSYA